MTKHAKLSPSAASRWLECTMAPTVEANFPETYSTYAAEGTFAHLMAELETAYALSMITEAQYNVRKARGMKNEFYNEELQDHALEYAAYVKEKVADLADQAAHVELEAKLDLTQWIPEGYGTADCIIMADDVLHVIDFKYGKGVKVEAEGNRQMMIYALGALAYMQTVYDVEKVIMVIIQPRLGGVSEAEIAASDLLSWGEEFLAPTAQIAFEGTGEYCPGENTCKFCRAAGSCKARADYFVSLFDEASTSGLLTPEQTAVYLARAQGMTDWLKAMEDTVFSALMSGKSIEGFKLVEGRSVRKYTDEEEIAKRLKAKKYKAADIFEKKLLGISKMEKLVGKKKLAEIIGDLIVKPKGAPTLAPENDKRPAIHPEEEIMEAFDEGEE